MLTSDSLHKQLAIADVNKDPYAVAAAAAALLRGDPFDKIASQFYVQALSALKLAAAAHRFLGTAPSSQNSGGIVPWTSRARRFAANLKALEERAPAGAAKVSAATAHLPEYELHQSADGNFHVLHLAGGLPVHASWLGAGGELTDHKALTRMWNYDRNRIQMPRPVTFDGLGMGWLPLHVAQTTKRTFLNYSCALYVIEPDPVVLAILLHVQDMQEFIADPRVRWFIADSPEQALADFRRAMDDNPLWSIPGGIIRCALRPRQGVNFDLAIKDLQASRDLKRADDVELARRHYAPMTRETWRRRFQDVMSGDSGIPPLRVMGITSRLTTVLQHSMAELKTAIESAGIPRAEVRIAIEPDDHSVEIPFVEVVRDFKPDLIVQLSRMRYENPYLPQNVPYLTWDQDNLPCMRTEAATASVSDPENPASGLTFVAGHGALQGFTHLNWPKRSVIFCHLAAATHRYTPRELTPAETPRYACDLSYISNASQSPEPLRDLHLRRLGPSEAALLSMLYDRIIGTTASNVPALHIWNETSLRTAAVGILKDRRLAISPAGMEEAVLVSVLIADRVFRHQTLEWVADFARATGRSFRLYGSGWEQHPTLSRFAAGPATPGEELQAITLASRINLQIIGTGVLHARLLDGLAAGGFFMFRRTENDLADPAHLESLQVVSRYAFDHGIESFAALDAVAEPAVERAWDVIGPAYRLQAMRVALSEQVILRGLSTSHALGHVLQLLPELDQVGFDTREDFAEKAKIFLDDDSRRRGITASLRRHILEHFSYDTRWRTFIEHIRRNL